MVRKAQMMLRIGNKRGFTLVEVLVTAAVLSVGIIFIYEALFVSLNLFNYYSNYLNIASWTQEKIWKVQDDLTHLGSLAQIEPSGILENQNRNFHWNLAYNLIDSTGLYRIDLIILWWQGRKEYKISRVAYAVYEEKK